MTAFPALVVSTLAQRQGRPEPCACGEIVYGDGGRGPVRCATCAVRRQAGEDADPLAVCFVEKFSERRA